MNSFQQEAPSLSTCLSSDQPYWADSEVLRLTPLPCTKKVLRGKLRWQLEASHSLGPRLPFSTWVGFHQQKYLFTYPSVLARTAEIAHYLARMFFLLESGATKVSLRPTGLKPTFLPTCERSVLNFHCTERQWDPEFTSSLPVSTSSQALRQGEGLSYQLYCVPALWIHFYTKPRKRCLLKQELPTFRINPSAPDLLYTRPFMVVPISVTSATCTSSSPWDTAFAF